MQHHITNITFIPRNVKTNYTRLKCNKVILIVLLTMMMIIIIYVGLDYYQEPNFSHYQEQHKTYELASSYA
jgi:hypothetical protein